MAGCKDRRETGQLSLVIESLGAYYHRKNRFRKTLKAALAYPALLLFTAVVVVLFMLTTVVPLFTGIFDQQAIELPLLTRYVVQFSHGVKTYGLLFLGGVLGSSVGLRALLKFRPIKRQLEHFGLLIPGFGSYQKNTIYFNFCQTMSLMLQAQLPLEKCLRLVNEQFQFIPLNEAITRIHTEIQEGKSVHQAWRYTSFFDSRMQSFLRIAEETHQLTPIFTELSDYYFHALTIQSKVLSSLLEPLIVMVVGIIIAVVLVAMYMPIFELSTVLG